MQLAAARGQWLTDMLREMPADEWPLWLAFMATQNLGPEGDDRRAGIIAAKIHNGLSSPKISPSDLFPTLKQKHFRRRPGERPRVGGGLRGFLNRMAPAAAH